MTDQMKISIIVPVYNVERYVEECLRSVVEQDFGGKLECIVVDDCGSDSSMAVVELYLIHLSEPTKPLLI